MRAGKTGFDNCKTVSPADSARSRGGMAVLLGCQEIGAGKGEGDAHFGHRDRHVAGFGGQNHRIPEPQPKKLYFCAPFEKMEKPLTNRLSDQKKLTHCKDGARPVST